MTVQKSMFFKLQQKDDKKEILKFEIKGNASDQSSKDLHELAGNIVVFKIEGCAAGETTAEFVEIKKNSNKTDLKFALKGDSEEKAQELYKFAGQNVKIEINPSQMTLDEFYGDDDEDRGIEYSVGKDGTVDVDPNQSSLEDFTEEEFDFDDEESEESVEV